MVTAVPQVKVAAVVRNMCTWHQWVLMCGRMARPLDEVLEQWVCVARHSACLGGCGGSCVTRTAPRAGHVFIHTSAKKQHTAHRPSSTSLSLFPFMLGWEGRACARTLVVNIGVHLFRYAPKVRDTTTMKISCDMFRKLLMTFVGKSTETNLTNSWP